MFGLGSLGGVMSSVKGLIGAFKLDPSEKKEFEAKMQALLQERDSEIEQTMRQELQAKGAHPRRGASLREATYTKAARPTVVYYGLFAIFCQLHAYSLPAMGFRGSTPEAFELPTEFWVAWGGIVEHLVVLAEAPSVGDHATKRCRL